MEGERGGAGRLAPRLVVRDPGPAPPHDLRHGPPERGRPHERGEGGVRLPAVDHLQRPGRRPAEGRRLLARLRPRFRSKRGHLVRRAARDVVLAAQQLLEPGVEQVAVVATYDGRAQHNEAPPGELVPGQRRQGADRVLCAFVRLLDLDVTLHAGCARRSRFSTSLSTLLEPRT